MKIILTSILLSLGVSAFAQQSRSSMTHSSINDDDKTMSIQVEGHVNGQDIHYSRRFNVTGLSSAQKDALKNSVFDSLGLGEAPKPPISPEPVAVQERQVPAPPKPPRAVEPADAVAGEETVTFACKTCTGRMRLELSGSNFSLTRDMDSKKEDRKPFPMTVSMRPGDYRYQYWQNGVLQMELPFTVKAGEANVVTVK